MSDQATLRILIADDAPDQSAVCRSSILREFPSASIACVSTGTECLARAEAGECDVIILDYKMPGMDGLEVLRRISQLRPHPLAILSTGYGDEAIAVEAMKLGASDYVMKSLDYAAVLPSVLARCLEIQRQQQELEAERTRNIQLAAIIQTTRALAHEINNPLQVIAGTCELLAVEFEKHDPFHARQATDLVTVCDRIADVIRRLYNVTHPVSQTRMGIDMLDIEASSTCPVHDAGSSPAKCTNSYIR